MNGPLLKTYLMVLGNNSFVQIYILLFGLLGQLKGSSVLGTILKGRLLKGVGRWVHQKEIY